MHFKNKLISWNETKEWCESQDTSLPIMIDRESLKEFLQIVEFTKDLPPVEAAYIGLYRNQSVSILLLKL